VTGKNPAQAGSHSRRLGSHILRIAVAAGLTGYLLWRSHPGDVLRAVASADPAWILLAVVLVLADRALMAYRWIALLCIVRPGQRPPLGRLFEVFFVSTFVGTFLPASIGGDAVRAYSISRDEVSGADAVASVFMDRMLGVAALLVMGVPGLFFARDLAANRAVLAGLAATAAISLATILTIFSERFGLWSARLIGTVPAPALRRMAHAIVESIRRYARFHWPLLNVLLASIAVQILRIVQAYCLGRSLGIDAALAAYFAFIPVILLIMLLPITVNGLGTSQAAFVWFFARVGVADAPAFVLSLLFVGLGIVGNLPGGLLYALSPSRIRRASRDASSRTRETAPLAPPRKL
jgi:glycosyltransferase 2 family protein